MSSLVFRCAVWLPLSLAVCNVTPSQERDIASHDIVRVDESRIIALEGHISRVTFDGWSLIVEADRSVFSANEFAAWDLHRTPDSEEVAD